MWLMQMAINSQSDLVKGSRSYEDYFLKSKLIFYENTFSGGEKGRKEYQPLIQQMKNFYEI